MSPENQTPTINPSPPLRTAVIGLGRIGFNFHAPAIVETSGITLAAVVDPLAERRVEAQHHWHVPAYPDLEALFSSEEIDLVVIASPTPFHAAQTIQSLQAGAHVVCDKPAAPSVADLDSMIAATKVSERKLIIYQPARLRPEIRSLKAILDRGVLGDLHTITRHRGTFSRRNDWQSLQAQGGGMLNNYGAHALDEILWLLDSPNFESIYCLSANINSAGDADDHTKAMLRTDRGVLIDLTFSQANASVPHPWQVHGSSGSAIWDESTKKWHLRYFDRKSNPPPALQGGLAASNRAYQTETLPWQEETVSVADDNPAEFYQAVRHTLVDGHLPPVSVEEGRALLVLIERCRRSAESGQPT